jgi:D-beta-D-heptose 7-phosphate kinase/D-beta-D-heptose 1-phosphate adenosyltransferase
MVKVVGLLSQLNPVRVLVIGDFMLDTYTKGKVKRISPEAPVSVLHVESQDSRPGGAGNVVLNLISLGASVISIGRIGEDVAGHELKQCLDQEGVDTSGIMTQKGFQTPVKNRLIADSQQVLRVDFETPTPISETFEQEVIKKTLEIIDTVQIIAISDYGKGFLSRLVIRTVIQNARKREIPVIVDPKGLDFSKYRHATIIKPNLSEAYAAAKLPQEAPLTQVADVILQTVGVDMLLITRSEAGMTLFTHDGERFDFPVRSKEVNDVTGAGDTVLAVISLALANGIDIKYGAQIANIAAGMAIERLGCARITLSALAKRLLELDVENKIFDEEHLFALKQALNGNKYIVLGVTSLQGMTTPLFRSIREVTSRDPDTKLIVYIRENKPEEEFVSLLSSLSEVDFIVLKCESLKNLCEIIQPIEVYVMEGDQLIELEHPSDLLEAPIMSSVL